MLLIVVLDYDDDPDESATVDHPNPQAEAEWEELDDYEDFDDPKGAENDDALSKYSSETLSSTRSKRLRDEEDDDAAPSAPLGTPGMSSQSSILSAEPDDSCRYKTCQSAIGAQDK